MRISDWSSDVCSSDLGGAVALARDAVAGDAPQQSADNRAADGVAMAAAADHVGIVARVISAAIGAVVIGIIRRRRIVDAGASLDRAFVAPLVTATVGRHTGDRKRVVKGKSVSVRVDLGGSRHIKKKPYTKINK